MENEMISSAQASVQRTDALSGEGAKFLTRVYGWMMAALLLSAGMAVFTASSPFMLNLIFRHYGLYVAIIAELVVVFVLGAKIRTMSTALASLLFVLYSLLNGVTLSSIFLVYQLGSIGRVFVISASMFGAMSVYGVITKRNLNTIGSYLLMGLFGVIIAGIVNFFLHSDMLEYIISIVGVGIFLGLTAWDTQKVMNTARNADDREAFRRVAILGALELYLDFVNLFLYLLRLFGRRK